MKVLMFGWEFPPHFTGGLGTACYGLTKGLSKLGVKVFFVIPKKFKEHDSDFLNIIGAGAGLEIFEFNSDIVPYITSDEYKLLKEDEKTVYARNIFLEVLRYAELTKRLSRKLDYDVIHAHDWLTGLAGIYAKQISKKPFIFHVHATELNRGAGLGTDGRVFEIEKKCMQEADIVVANSRLIKNIIIKNYGINESKIRVVHNAVEFKTFHNKNYSIETKDKVVLFLGRLTIQKGADFFIKVAKKILEYDPNYLFIIAGKGELMDELINKTIQAGISDKLIFTGFVPDEMINSLYQRADLYVMPSVSEPFGITPLEAIRNGTPVLISKQSGVGEVLQNALKTDFWDVDEMANQIISVLNHTPAHKELTENSIREVKEMTWDTPAKNIKKIYEELT